MPIRLAAILALAAGAHAVDDQRFAPVRVNDVVEYYPIEGDSIAHIRARIRDHAPDGASGTHGRTQSRFEVETELAQRPDSCSLGRLQVSVDIVMVLPEWRPTARAPAAVHGQWAAAIERLTRHEEGHRRHAVEAAHALRTDLMRLPPETDCMRMQLRVDDRIRRATWRLRMRDRFYDARTDAGLRDDPLDP